MFSRLSSPIRGRSLTRAHTRSGGAATSTERETSAGAGTARPYGPGLAPRGTPGRVRALLRDVPVSPLSRGLVAVPLVLLALTACGGSDAAGPTRPAAPGSATPAAPTTAVPSDPEVAPTPAGKAITLTVAGGKVSGDTGTIEVDRGVPLHITVTSDVADEVHVHGADVSKDVEAGGTVVLDTAITVPGRFEVELEGAKLTLTRLQVR